VTSTSTSSTRLTSPVVSENDSGVDKHVDLSRVVVKHERVLQSHFRADNALKSLLLSEFWFGRLEGLVAENAITLRESLEWSVAISFFQAKKGLKVADPKKDLNKNENATKKHDNK